MDELLALEPGLCPGEAWKKANSKEDMPEEVCDRADEEARSEISVDSNGFPNMLRSPAERNDEASGSRGLKECRNSKKDVLLSKKPKSHRETLEQQAAKAATKLAVATPKKPMKSLKRDGARLKRPAGQSETVAKRPGKRPCPTEKDQTEVPELPGKHFRVGLYTQQSYIQVWSDGKWRLLISCTEKMAANYEGGHQAVIQALEPHCRKPGCAKEKMLALRTELLV